ncbi:MAG TPA: hypothetical protein VHB98_08635 [Chloroflexota bacterium]|nr:hypothetical protein [Chloroflexota bacterium]
MSTKDQYATLSAVRWGAAASIAFGSFGWLIGMTVPGQEHGTSLVATICFSFVMGALAFIPGSIVGRTLAELRPRIV